MLSQYDDQHSRGKGCTLGHFLFNFFSRLLFVNNVSSKTTATHKNALDVSKPLETSLLYRCSSLDPNGKTLSTFFLRFSSFNLLYFYLTCSSFCVVEVIYLYTTSHWYAEDFFSWPSASFLILLFFYFWYFVIHGCCQLI